MRLVVLPIHHLHLEAFVKTLHRGIVITIATTTLSFAQVPISTDIAQIARLAY